MKLSFLFPERIAAYGSPCAPLLEAAEVCDVGPGRPVEGMRAALAALTPASLGGSRPVRDADMAACCLSGLWLLFNFLDESHTISQSIATSTGSYWHGIMHRREPDYSNAKYWFRRVGRHPVFEPLARHVREWRMTSGLAAPPGLRDEGPWDPFAFVDLCERAVREPQWAEFCRVAGWIEWQLLFDMCFRHAYEDPGS